MEFELRKNWRGDTALRASFNALVREVFGFDFENWHRNGFWTDSYIPYSFVRDGRIAANVSVNVMNMSLDGEALNLFQLGTVLSAPEFRGRGLIRKLMEAIFRDAGEGAEFYLFANESVLNFYPKFGFEKWKQYQYTAPISNRSRHTAQAVPMETAEDWSFFRNIRKRYRSQSRLVMDNDGLLMFYLSQSLRKNVWYVNDADAYTAAEIENGRLVVHDVFVRNEFTWPAFFQAFGPDVREAVFTFPPRRPEGLRKEERTNGDSLFIKGDGLRRRMDALTVFPELSHA